MIKVAILDTGIDANHNQLSKYINFDISKSFIDKSLKDYHGHGTAIAGVTIYDGFFNEEDKDIQLIIIKITNEMVFNIDIFIEAFEYVIELGVNIINLSLSIYNSKAKKRQKEKIANLVKVAYDKEITIVASSGNRWQEDNFFNQYKNYTYVVTSKNFYGNIASYSRKINNTYSVFGGDIDSISDYSKIEKCLVVSTFPEYLPNDYFNYFGVPKGYSYYWGTSIATARFTHKVIKVFEKYDGLNNDAKQELDKYLYIQG